MIYRNICPICGSENPEGAEICQVCKANLVALLLHGLATNLATSLQTPQEA